MDAWRLSLEALGFFGFACRKPVTLSGRTSITPLGDGGVCGSVDYEWVRHRNRRLQTTAPRLALDSLAAPKLSPSLLALSLSPLLYLGLY